MKASTLPRIFLFLAFFLWVEDLQTAPLSLNSKSSDRYPVEVYSTSAIAIEDVLVTANQSMDLYMEVFKQEFPADFKVTYLCDIKKGDGQAAFDRSLVLKTSEPLEFKIYVRGNPSEQSEAIARTTFIVLLQMQMTSSTTLKAGEKLKDPPFWLVEGLTQKHMTSQGDGAPRLLQDYQKIIVRYASVQRYPTLTVLQAWKELSPHILERIWQQAFCWKLVNAALQRDSDRDALLAWIKRLGANESDFYWPDSPQNKSWWDIELKSPFKRQLPILSYRETGERLTQALRFNAVLRGSNKLQNLSISDLPREPGYFVSKDVFEDLSKRLFELRGVGNFAWGSVINSYFSALLQWKKGEYKEYRELIAQAQEMHAVVIGKMRKVNDLMDWYEINFPVESTLMDTTPYLEIFDADSGRSSLIQGIMDKQTLILR